MRVQLLYFGVLKDFFAAERDVVELADGTPVSTLLPLLRGRAGVALPLWESLAVGVNGDWACAETILHEGDEVALLPPVSGGSA